MSCGTCIRWRKRPKPPRELHNPRWATRFGFCGWPGIGPKPYWHAEHPDNTLMVADCHGEGCLAFKEKKAR